MPTPTDYIFTPGTCLKKDFYGVLTNALIGAGWTNVTSNYATDGDVFTSTGNNGDKALIINLRKVSHGGDNDVTTTVGVIMSIRFPTSYTPGEPGVSGTFVRTGLWRQFSLAPINATSVALGGTGALDMEYNYKLYVDKNKFIVSVEYPLATNLGPVLSYVGLPDSNYTDDSANRGIVYAATIYAVNGSTLIPISDSPNGVGSSADIYALILYTSLPAKVLNNEGSYAVSEVYYGSAVEGVRGKLDGVLLVNTTILRTGYKLQIGSHVYYVLQCNTTGYGANTFPSNTLAIRIS
jgi:hypothetical protein